MPAPPLQLPALSPESTLVANQASVQDNVATATGDVHLERDGQTLEAPYVRYNRKTSEAEAHGGLKYYRSGLFLTADQGNVNTNNKTGAFENTHYELTTSGGRGSAAQVKSLDDGSYQLTNADYSTCAGATKAWLLSAKRIDLNRASGRGVAHDATMRVYGVPVLYTPYINFPIDNQRHTGFLAPTFGKSGDSGFQLSAPYYINLNPQYDATLVPTILAKRGFLMGGQFRYLTDHDRGEFDGQYLPDDQKYGSSRSLLHLEQIGELNPYVGYQTDYNRVSDDEYFDDLSNDLSHSSSSQLERAGAITLAKPGIRFRILAQDFQTLDNDRQNHFDSLYSTQPYARAPQATLSMLTPSAPFRLGVDGQFTNFRREGSIDAYREDIRPRIVWGVDHGGWYASSEGAYRVTRYDLRNFDNAVAPIDSRTAFQSFQAGNDVINREIPTFEADSGLRFSRSFGNGWIQTLEPRAHYLLSAYQNQDNIPIFDTGTADLSYDQLFADNRYAGIDRIGDANQLALGVTSRFIAPDSGRTVLKLDAGRVTGFRDIRVRLPDSGETGYGVRGSDYVAGATLAPYENVRADTAVQYDPDNSRINRALATTTIGNRAGYQLDLGYRYYRDYRPGRDIVDEGDNDHHDYQTNIIPGVFETLSQTVLGFRAPLGNRLDLIGRWNYSIERSQNVETLAGVEYRPSCCYAARVAVRHYVANDDGSQDTAILFQFVLNGLGQFGDTAQTFTDRDVFSNDTTGRSSDSFDTIDFQ